MQPPVVEELAVRHMDDPDLKVFGTLVDGEDHASGPTMTAEPVPAFRQENASEDFPDDFRKGDAAMVASELAVTFPLIEMDNCGVLEILREFSLTRHHPEERRQMIYELGTSVRVDLNRDRIRCGRFPTGELLHSPDGFVERGREVEVGVGLHVRQPDDGGFEYGGVAMANASDLPCLSL
nr:unnamed protein product [Spirometra erinaceieuropaei]